MGDVRDLQLVRGRRGDATLDQVTVVDHEVDSRGAWPVQDMLLDSENLADFLDQLTAVIARRFSREGSRILCSITLLRERRPGTVAASGPDAAALDAFQNSFSEGPCLTAALERAVIRVGDVREDTRWEEYHAAVAERGIRSILAVPFDLRGEASTALNIYSTKLGDFSPETTEAAVRAVQRVSGALLLAVRADAREQTEKDLRAVLTSRTPIDLAIGVIMGQNRCSQEEAVEILKAASSHRNVKLRDLAADLLKDLDGAAPASHFES